MLLYSQEVRIIMQEFSIKPLVDELKEERIAKGLTLEAVSNKIGIPPSTISKIENGSQRLEASVLIKLANLYDLSLDKLLNLNQVEKTVPVPVKDTRINYSNEKDIAEAFSKILNEYLAAKEQPFKGNPMGDYIRNEFTNILKEKMNLDKDIYRITGSVGQGNFAEITWTAIFNRRITVSALKGYYVVYLFCADMSGFYLSLNQGWTYYKEKYGLKEGKEKIHKVAEHLREKLDMIPPELSLDYIDLNGVGDLASGYEAGHICGKYYEAENLDANELYNDLSNMLLVYKELFSYMNNRELEEFNDSILYKDDGKFTDETEEDSFNGQLEEELATTHTKRLPRLFANDQRSKRLLRDDEPEERHSPLVKKNGEKTWLRDVAISAAAVEDAGYKCEVDPEHTSFYSKATGKPFMEAHHLIPMKLQGQMKYSLDKRANIVCLCPNCHRLLHHGIDEERAPILKKLFYLRRQALEDLKLYITLPELNKSYNIDID